MPFRVLARFIPHPPIMSRMLWICFRRNYSIKLKKMKKKIHNQNQKKIFFLLFTFRSSRRAIHEISKFRPDLIILNFHFFVPRTNSEWWRAETKSGIPCGPDSQTDDEREKIIPLAPQMAEIWPTEGLAAPPKTTIKWQKRETMKNCKKSWFFPKMKMLYSECVKNISTTCPSGACASFIYTLQKNGRPRSMAKCKKPDFRSLSIDLGHFLTSDVIL